MCILDNYRFFLGWITSTTMIARFFHQILMRLFGWISICYLALIRIENKLFRKLTLCTRRLEFFLIAMIRGTLNNLIFLDFKIYILLITRPIFLANMFAYLRWTIASLSSITFLSEMIWTWLHMLETFIDVRGVTVIWWWYLYVVNSSITCNGLLD